jgi:hypothetical protein
MSFLIFHIFLEHYAVFLEHESEEMYYLIHNYIFSYFSSAHMYITYNTFSKNIIFNFSD